MHLCNGVQESVPKIVTHGSQALQLRGKAQLLIRFTHSNKLAVLHLKHFESKFGIAPYSLFSDAVAVAYQARTKW